MPAPLLSNYVAGSWVDAGEGGTLEDRDPATGETLALVPRSGAADVDAAVRAARAAQPAWRETPPQERARAVLALREALVEHRREELAALVTADMGKTLADADGEVGRGIESVEAAAAIPHLLKGENLEGVAARRRRRDGPPAGRRRRRDHPVQLPGDDPALVPAVRARLRQRLHPQALRARPAPVERIFELLEATGAFPPGVVNLVHGGRDAVDGLLDHPGVDAVSFVGQASTARLIATPLRPRPASACRRSAAPRTRWS